LWTLKSAMPSRLSTGYPSGSISIGLVSRSYYTLSSLSSISSTRPQQALLISIIIGL
jgi:hypothetical protein